MPDVALLDRQAIMELAYRKLRDPAWRSRLTAHAPDGSRPIVFALADDPMQKVVKDADNVGGSANVVLPVLNGIAVFTIEDATPEDLANGAPRITEECTVGLFFQRLVADGGHATYCLPSAGNEHSDSGRAELVALAG